MSYALKNIREKRKRRHFGDTLKNSRLSDRPESPIGIQTGQTVAGEFDAKQERLKAKYNQYLAIVNTLIEGDAPEWLPQLRTLTNELNTILTKIDQPTKQEVLSGFRLERA